MSRVAIPLTSVDRTGVAGPSQTDADATNKHTLENPSSRTLLEVVSSDGSDQTLTIYLAGIDPVLLDGASTPTVVKTIPAGTTRWYGGFQKSTYNNRDAISADGKLTSDATSPAAADTVTIGSTTYTFRSTLTEVKASVTLTSDATAPSNNDTVTVGTHVYTYKTVLTGAADEVLIGASAAAALTNLKAAIAGTAGAGTTYGTGTVAHTTVDASTLTSTTLLLVAKAVGVAGNSYASTETSTHLSFGTATLLGGVDAIVNEVLIGGSAANALTNLKKAINDAGTEGTDYSTGTAAHASVTAGTLTSTTLVVTASTAGTDGNAIATTESSAHLSWGAATLLGGIASGGVLLIDPSVSTSLKFRAYNSTT